MTSGPINHRHFKTAVIQLRKACEIAVPGQMIFLIGPSGVGKTEIRQYVMRQLFGRTEQWVPNTLPAIHVLASSHDGSRFSPRQFAQSLVDAVQFPKLSWATAPNSAPSEHLQLLEAGISTSQAAMFQLARDRSQASLIRTFEYQVALRKVRYVFVDEAASLCNVKGRTDQEKLETSRNNVLTYMQLAEKTETVWILCGTHLASPLWQAYADAQRRALLIWVRRYRENIASEKAGFAEILKAVSSNLPLDSPDLLLRTWKLCLINSAGTYGNLKSYLQAAEIAASGRGSAVITEEDLELAARPEVEQSTLWAAARACDRLSAPHGKPLDDKNLDLRWK